MLMICNRVRQALPCEWTSSFFLPLRHLWDTSRSPTILFCLLLLHEFYFHWGNALYIIGHERSKIHGVKLHPSSDSSRRDPAGFRLHLRNLGTVYIHSQCRAVKRKALHDSPLLFLLFGGMSGPLAGRHHMYV